MIPPRCRIIQGQLARFVDDVLEGQRALAVSDHLQLCSRCLEAERIARGIPIMLASSLGPPPPATLLPRLLAACRELQHRDRRATAVAATAVLLLAAATLAGTRPLLDSSRTPPMSRGSHRPPVVLAAGAAASVTASRPAPGPVVAVRTAGRVSVAATDRRPAAASALGSSSSAARPLAPSVELPFAAPYGCRPRQGVTGSDTQAPQCGDQPTQEDSVEP